MHSVKKHLYLAWWGIAAVALYLLLSFTGVLPALIARSDGAVHPLSRFFARSASSLSGWFDDKSTLSQAREDLDRAAAAFALRELTLEQCAQEKKELQDALHYRARTGISGVSARITGFDVVDHNLAFLDRGEDAGIRAGMAVVAYDGILIGRVRTAEYGRSSVSLLQERGTSIAVTFASRSDAEAILTAQAGGLIVGLLPQHSSLATSTLVITAGVDARIPRGLIIGRVKEVGKDRSQPYVSALVEPIIPYRQVRTVTVYAP